MKKKPCAGGAPWPPLFKKHTPEFSTTTSVPPLLNAISAYGVAVTEGRPYSAVHPAGRYSNLARRVSGAAASVIFVTLSLFLQGSAFQAGGDAKHRVEGVVKDQTGAPVGYADVTLTGPAFSANTITNSEGRFVFEGVQQRAGKITVRASGFAVGESNWKIEGSSANLDITLSLASVTDQITVTAARTETRLGDTPSSIALISHEALNATAALALDDALRQVPGFSLFRRSGSRYANPTSQGVSLRGVGPSGASRASVLVDGIPLNDPFGGWVYWGRVSRESIERTEILRGGASSLYGSDALGGVVNVITRKSSDPVLLFEGSYGNQATPATSVFAAGRLGAWGGSFAVHNFHTDGYIIVDEAQRGRVDTPAASEYYSVDLNLDRKIGETARAFARGSLFGEARENGTPLQTNRTHMRQLAAGVDWRSKLAGTFSLRGFGGTEVFDQYFTAIAADRNSESLTRSQRSPSQQTGLAAQWSRPAGSIQTFVAGIDARQVRGASNELAFAAGRVTSAVEAGGREGLFGIFGEDIIRIARRWFVTAGLRFDRWRNYAAASTTKPLAAPGPRVVTVFPDRDETAVSPRLSVLNKVTDNVSLLASFYRSFRAPTLNELYRSFRVGNVLTLANDKLRAERLTGGEAGVNVTAFKQRLNARGVFFWSEVDGPVANVTLSVTPALITRQRQNLGGTRSRGVEMDAEARITHTLTLSGGYEFLDATVLSFPANVSLEGLMIPQVPRHQLTFQMRYSDPSTLNVSFQGRFASAQFDDDQNKLALSRYFTLDGMISRSLGKGVELFVAGENLLNQRYETGRTPVTTLGPRLLARAGIRLQLGAK